MLSSDQRDFLTHLNSQLNYFEESPVELEIKLGPLLSKILLVSLQILEC